MWAPAAVLSLYLKREVMHAYGFHHAALQLGWHGDFNRWQKLPFFQNDLLVGFLVAPLLLFAATNLLRSWFRILIVTIVSAFTALLLFGQLEALRAVGHFVSLRMLVDAIVWGLQDPGIVSSYLRRSDVAILFGTVLLVGAAAWWNATQPKETKPLASEIGRRREDIAASALWVALLVAAALPWFVGIPAGRYRESAILWAEESLFASDSASLAALRGLDGTGLMQRYRQLTNAPAGGRSRYFGSARSFDVLFFVLETGPARCLDIESDLEDLPTLRRLRARSFVARQHYSTAPLTNRAVFSLLTSLYPLNSSADFLDLYPSAVVPGVMRSLAGAGYRTGVYSPKEPRSMVQGDNQRLTAVGVQSLFWPDPGSLPEPGGDGLWQQKADRDRRALSLLIHDMERWGRAGQRFAAVFLPQIGHAPWPDVTGGKAKNVLERGRAVMAFQDRFLLELVKQLEVSGRLEKTIIVVTGDHGIRTQSEDPLFKGDRVDEYTFHVPLLIYVPGVLSSPEPIDWVTSHIDLCPSVLDLLGFDEGRNFEEGSPLWNPAIAKRSTYFFGKYFLGADGYASASRFSMWSYLTESAYRGTTLQFADGDMVESKSPVSSEVHGSIGAMADLQGALTAKVCEAVAQTGPRSR